VCVAMLDRNMNYLATSGRWLASYSRGQGELVGLNHYDINYDVPRRWKVVHKEALAGVTSRSDEDLWVQADGSRLWIRWTVQPWIDQNRAIGGLIITTEDLTARKRAEQELRASEERCAAFIRDTREGTLRDISEQKRIEHEQRLLAEAGRVLVNAGSDPERLLTDVADLLMREFGDFCVVDVIDQGQPWRYKVVHSDPARAAACEALARYPLQRELSYLLAETLRTRSRSLVSEVTPEYLESIAQGREHLAILRALAPTSFVAVPLFAREQFLGVLGVGSSRTARRFGRRDAEMLEELASRIALAIDNARLHSALQKAVLARDDVLGIVAHDLRSPLNTIVLQSQMLEASDPPKRCGQSASDSIVRAAMRMNRLIQDLLDVTRAEAGREISIIKEAVAPRTLVADAIELQRNALQASKRTLLAEVEENLPDVDADRQRILQVFDNLLGNAAKFTSCGNITVGAAARGAEVLFWVADEGAGIPPAAIPHLFERFWQAERGDHRGAGLGLSIVRGIVDAHGGRVWVESALGRGTTFYFTLPPRSCA